MPPLLMSGFDRQHLPTRSLRAVARGITDDPIAARVSTGQLKAWDLLGLTASTIPGAAPWAEKTLDALVASAADRYLGALDCEECTDLGFYGLVSRENPDLLTALLRREGDGGYQQLTASGAWADYDSRYDQQVEILSRDLAGDLAEAITAGASGLVRRYFWPKAFLPPETMIAAAPAKELTAPAAGETEKVTAGPEDGWTEYAVVDDLDPGAVLDLIRLRPGPELVVYRNGVWGEDNTLLSDLQGVQPPPLVELDQAQLDSVLQQVGGDAKAREDASTAAPATDATTAAAGALVADAPLTVSPDPRAEKLRRYWTTGKGAAKIRWGTKGDWTRCYRQLRKHMGVRAKGYCQNLHKRSTGMWTGDRLNASGDQPLSAAGQPARPALSVEAALVASVSTGAWLGPEGAGDMTLKDGIYVEAGDNVTLLRTLTAGGFPVAPPDDWFSDPQLEGPTPLTVDDDGRVSGHIATFDIAHIGLPGRVHAPKSRSNYAYFKTGQLVTASGAKVNVGQLTLAGGHAPLQADAAAAVAHYDNTASAVADLNMGEDRFGIWVAGALRPEVTPSELRALRASAPSGDWRPINGQLELVAVCQVNVPGFPTTRARVASGAITSLVAAGAGPLYARRMALLSDAAVAERITALEAHIFGVNDGPDLTETAVAEGIVGDEAQELLADGVEPVAVVEEPSVTDGTDPVETPAEEAPAEEKPVSDAVARARAAVAERKAAEQEAAEAAARRQALRDRVHGAEAVAAAAKAPVGKKSTTDPDGDGDDDTNAAGDTDHDVFAAAVPGANPEIVHSQIAGQQGLGDLSHPDLVTSLHGDYKGDAAKFSKDLAKGKVKHPAKKKAPAVPAVAASGGPGNS